MSTEPEPRPRARSAFAAAFLSLLFPGLGHAYAGAWHRALAFATPAILMVALGAGVFLRIDRLELLGIALENLFLIQVLNVLLLAYRVVAALDAYRVSIFLNAHEVTEGSRLGRPRVAISVISVAGLLAVLLVMAGGHGVVGYYVAQAQSLVDCVFDDQGTANCDEVPDGGPDASGSASASLATVPPAESGEPQDSEIPTDEPLDTSTPGAETAPPAASIPPWDGKGRLNILLVGVDQRAGSGVYNTDTLIVVSVDPATRRVAMLSLPRDTVDVPLPPGRARSVYGLTYGGKINSLWGAAQRRSDLFSGNNAQRGFIALKQTLGYLYGLQISYYAVVNFEGFKKVVDTLGGVTINVQIPVIDDNYPGEDGIPIRVYIPSGIQHMTGSEALIYARSRHGKYGTGSNDFDRGARQQRVLLSIREQVDPSAVIGQLPDLVNALKRSVKTDIPVNMLPKLLGLAGSVDTKNIRSYVFSPPSYGRSMTDSRGYVIEPDVARIRSAVARAFQGTAPDQDLQEALAEEGAQVLVLNGTGNSGQASDLASYLEYLGLAASAPNQRPDIRGGAPTVIRVYNGAEGNLPKTIALLEKTFKVTVKPTTNPAVTADIIIVTGTSTPKFTPPP